MTSSDQIEATEAETGGGRSVASWRIRLALAGIFVFTLIGFRAILIAPFGLIEPSEFEYWFFIPEHDSGALAVLIAGWLLWNRRTRLVALCGRPVRGAQWVAGAAILASFLWSLWSGTPTLLVPVLAAHIAVLANAWGGREGFHAVAMPCLALLFAFSPPSPLEAEIVWGLQQLTASGAHMILSLAGEPAQLEGTEILLHSNAFAIIEACSGWRGIQVLSVIALVASELRHLSLARALWVVAAAAPLGLALNTIRVCLVVMTQEEVDTTFFQNHTPQGIVVLLIGSMILYALATRIQRLGRPIGSETRPVRTGTPDGRAHAITSFIVFGLVSSGALCATSLLIPHFHEVRERPDPGKIEFPEDRPPWTSTKLPPDYFFPYATVAPPQFHAEYRNTNAPGGEQVVDLYIAREVPDPSGLDRLPETKLLLPANDWSIDSYGPKRVWSLGLDGLSAILSRADESKFTYVEAWRLGDKGLWRESVGSLLGLDSCDALHPDCFRTVLRVAVPILHDDDRGRQRAIKTAENFIRDFKDAFEALDTTSAGPR